MHEAGVATRILQAVLARAEVAGARRVTVVEIEAGEACGVAGESLELHFGEHARGTIAEGASLVVRRAGDPAAFRLVAIDVEDGPGADG